MIYLDNAATTMMRPEVLSAMMPYLTNEFGNPGSNHAFGRKARKAVENARCQVSQLIGADPEEIIFTSGGTEANNMVLYGIQNLVGHSKRHIVTGANEHDSILNTAKMLQIMDGFNLSLINPDSRGSINVEEVKKRLDDPSVGIVSIMHTNNETGSVNPVNEIGELCREMGVVFHSDCVQAITTTRINVKDIGCQFASMSAHKINGPKGVGALFISKEYKDKLLFRPLISGGLNQEFGFRGGTENVASIVGFGKACELLQKDLWSQSIFYDTVRAKFYTELIKSLSNYEIANIVHINGEDISQSGKVLNLRFDGIDGETLLLLLSSYGVYMSAGSACNSSESIPSHVLKSMGLSDEQAWNSIRISFSSYHINGEESRDKEIIDAARVLAQCVYKLYNYNK